MSDDPADRLAPSAGAAGAGTSPATRKEVWAWGLYDLANSPFATTILAVIFNRYFVTALAGGETGVVVELGPWSVRVPGVTFFTYTLTASMLIVGLIAPVLGAIADYSGSKKRFLALFCYLGVGATGMLYFIEAGEYWKGAIFFTVAEVGFACSNIFYNAFLREISTPKNIGWISGFGFTLGYLGGAVLLALNLVMLTAPQYLGASEPFTPQDCFLSVAIWWGVFSVPTFLWLRERQREVATLSAAGYVRAGFHRLRVTFQRIRGYSQLSKFLVAFLIYNDGIQTVIVVAAIFAEIALGMSEGEVISLFLLVQATAFVGAIVLGAVSDRIGNKRTVVLTLVLWSVVVVWGYFIGFTGNERAEIWGLGVLAGLILGGSQSASRALQGLFTPQENAAEFYAFFGIVGKFSAVLGPFTYGSIYALTGDIRTAILSLIFFFLAGLGLLLWVDEKKGIEQAERAVV